MNLFLRAFLVAASLMMAGSVMAQSPIARMGEIGGGQDVGGGSGFEPEFKLIGREILQRIKDARLTSHQLGYEIVALEIAMNEIQPIGDGEKKEILKVTRHGLNSSEARVIRFTDSMWAIYNRQQKELFVLHEYLKFVVGNGDAEYTYTLRTFDLLKNGSSRFGGRGQVSARAKKFKFVEPVYIEHFSFHFFGVHDLTKNKVYPFNVGCEGQHLKIRRREHYSRDSSFPEDTNLGVTMESVAQCEAMKAILWEATTEKPVIMIYDPVRALSFPNELLTFEF